MPYQSYVKSILQTTYYPRLRIWNFLNQLGNKQSFLGDNEQPHQINQNIIILFS